MKKIYLLFFIPILFSCNQIPVSSASIATTGTNASKQLKTLNEIKLTLLDGRCEKAELLLGKPDKKGRLLRDLSGDTGFLVYFDKVSDDNKTKNLLIIVDSEHHINDESKITDVKALNYAQSSYIDHGVSITVVRKNVECDGRAFKMADGTADWFSIY